MKDTYYTKEALANKLINYIPEDNYNSVVDFCIGEGDLIKAAVSRWPKINCYGTDINNDTIIKLRNENLSWQLDTCDFINDEEIGKCDITKAHNKYDIILLNPPFTCKGSTVHQVYFDGDTYYVSTAMQFLLRAIKYLHKDSILLGILPISCAYSKKDQKIWKKLETSYNLTILEELDKESFKNCNPNIALVEINNHKTEKRNKTEWYNLNYQKKVDILRGNLSVNEITNYRSSDGIPFIHTTNLSDHQAKINKELLKPIRSVLNGPAVLITRVGNPKKEKICKIDSESKVVISDCIIALKTENEEDTNELQSLLINNWDSLKSLYKGTAAKYVTMERIRNFLYSK